MTVRLWIEYGFCVGCGRMYRHFVFQYHTVHFLVPSGYTTGILCNTAIELYARAGKSGKFNKHTAFINECFMNIIGTGFM